MADSGSRFAEAVDRMDRFIQDVKARQFAATGAKLPPAPRPRPVLHPDEDWQTRYATRSIRPLRRGESPAPMPEFAAPLLPERPRFPDTLPSEKVSDPVPRGSPPGHIGAVLGKPGKKRGLLGRLLRGRDN
jgi:hypothetical protein